jgi:hypothetical protein
MSDTLHRASWDGHPLPLGTGFELHKRKGDRDLHVVCSLQTHQPTPLLRCPFLTRWFTRLTNAFSKKVENHAAAIALHFMDCNLARVQKTLRCLPR